MLSAVLQPVFALAARPRISVLTSGRLLRNAQTLVSSSHFYGSAPEDQCFLLQVLQLVLEAFSFQTILVHAKVLVE